MQGIVPGAIEQTLNFIGVVVVTDELRGFRTVCLFDRVGRNDPTFDSRFERQVQHRVMSLGSRSFQAVVADVDVIVVDLIACHFLDTDVQRFEEWDHPGLHHHAVAVVGRFADVGLVILQPHRQVFLYQHITDAYPILLSSRHAVKQVLLFAVVLL